jgi:predicted  nucleic acid-binding Zn-ribbon protein
MFKNMRWICNKHDKILDLSNCKGDETLEELIDRMNDIYSLTVDAKSDGEKMENGLNEKKKKIEELERELEDCKNKISELEEKVYQTS